MSNLECSPDVTVDAVEAVLAEKGYEVSLEDENLLRVRDPESGITVRSVLENNVLFLTVPCAVVPSDSVTTEMMRKMLDAENGISTSSFQIYDLGSGQVSVTLNNFCKLQKMGTDDEDDILSCLEFLVVDVIAARELLGDLGT